MCRHLAYLGPETSVADLVFDPPHSLERQAFAPTQMEGGATINVDGFGAGWYPAEGRPLRYRRAVPIWADATFRDLSPTFRGHAVMAAVRGATPGMGGGDGACAPFADGQLLGSFNGYVDGWPTSAARLAGLLPPAELLSLPAATDAALLWAVLGAGLREGVAPGAAVDALVASLIADAPGSRLNLLVTDGLTVWATRYRNSLWVRRIDHSLTVASEPLDDGPGWQPVPEGHLLTADPTYLDLRRIGTAGDAQ